MSLLVGRPAGPLCFPAASFTPIHRLEHPKRESEAGREPYQT